MLLDARRLDPRADVEADICIVGAGAAGITIARQFIDCPLRVVVLEGGGIQPDRQSQAIYQGATTGQPYYALDDCRVRYLGGTTNTWGGWCRPLDAIDFTERDWLPHSGWPFSRGALLSYYERAHATCRLAPCDYDASRWNTEGVSLVSPDAPDLADTLFHVGPTRFGHDCRPALERAANVRLLLHASAIEIVMDPSRRRAVALVAGTSTGQRFTVRAGTVILAAGGIENPRLLLASRQGGCDRHRERSRSRRPLLRRSPARAGRAAGAPRRHAALLLGAPGGGGDDPRRRHSHRRRAESRAAPRLGADVPQRRRSPRRAQPDATSAGLRVALNPDPRAATA